MLTTLSIKASFCMEILHMQVVQIIKKGLILQSCMFSQTFYPNLQIFLHWYIHHIRDIFQLWQKSVTYRHIPFLCLDVFCFSLAEYLLSSNLNLVGLGWKKISLYVIGRPRHSEKVARRGSIYWHPTASCWHGWKNDDEYQCKIKMQNPYRFPRWQISSLDSNLTAIKKPFIFERLFFQSKSTIHIKRICRIAIVSHLRVDVIWN